MSTVAFLRIRTTVSALALAIAVAGPAIAAGEGDSQRIAAPADLRAQASAALAQGDLRIAVERFTAVIEAGGLSEEERARARLNRGLAYQRQGLFAKAAEDYGAALEVEALDVATRAIALYNRGLAYRKLSQPGRAVDDFTNALFLNAELAEAYMSRGILMQETGRPLYALNDFDKALKYNFSRPHLAHYARALIFAELDRPDDAKSALSRALMVKPDFEDARAKLAELGGGTAPDRLLASASVSADPAVEADTIATGSIGAAGKVEVVTRTELPEAVRPPRALLGLEEDTATTVAAAGPAPEPAAASAAPARGGAKPVRIASAEPGIPAEAAAATSPVDDASLTESRPEGWLVQLSSQREEAAAWNAWKAISAKHAAQVGDGEPMVVRADLGTKGIYYRLRLAGFSSRKDADKTCSALKSRGASCFVAKAE